MTLLADNFLAGAVLTLLLPTLLLIAIAVFLHWMVARVPSDISPAATAPPPPEVVIAAQAEASGRIAPGEQLPADEVPAPPSDRMPAEDGGPVANPTPEPDPPRPTS